MSGKWLLLKFTLIVISFTFSIILRDTEFYDFSALFTHQTIGKCKKGVLKIFHYVEYKNCLLECGFHEQCDAVNYNEDEEICELIQTITSSTKQIDVQDVDSTNDKWRFIHSADINEYHENECLEFTQAASIHNSKVVVAFGSSKAPCQCFLEGVCYTILAKASNLAIDGDAAMSTTYNNAINKSALINDGKFNLTDHIDYIEAHTKDEDTPWLQVTLTRIARLYMIRMINKANEYRDRLVSIQVQIGNTSGKLDTCFDDIDGSAIVDVRVYCNQDKAIAKIIRIQKTQNGYLALQEIETYGVYL